MNDEVPQTPADEEIDKVVSEIAEHIEQQRVIATVLEALDLIVQAVDKHSAAPRGLTSLFETEEDKASGREFVVRMVESPRSEMIRFAAAVGAIPGLSREDGVPEASPQDFMLFLLANSLVSLFRSDPRALFERMLFSQFRLDKVGE